MRDHLQKRGRIKKGQPIAWIDSRDYRLALAQEDSRVRKAHLDLDLEKGRGDIAAKEWALLAKSKDAKGSALALRTPHLEVAKESLRAAESGQARAKLALERTVLRAPFNA